MQTNLKYTTNITSHILVMTGKTYFEVSAILSKNMELIHHAWENNIPYSVIGNEIIEMEKG